MLNRVIIMGRITQDLTVNTTKSGKSALNFSIAVERNFANAEGKRDTDFIRCVAFDKTADHIAKYFGKGRLIAIEGGLRTSSYTPTGAEKPVTVLEVNVEKTYFTGEKAATTAAPAAEAAPAPAAGAIATTATPAGGEFEDF